MELGKRLWRNNREDNRRLCFKSLAGVNHSIRSQADELKL